MACSTSMTYAAFMCRVAQAAHGIADGIFRGITSHYAAGLRSRCGRPGNRQALPGVSPAKRPHGVFPMRGVLAWLIGIPIPIIILLYLFDVF